MWFTFSLAVSSNPECPWIAVGFQPGEMLKPKGFKLVYCYNWNTRSIEQIFDAGKGEVKSQLVLLCVHCVCGL